jgi:hypothetical protein
MNFKDKKVVITGPTASIKGGGQGPEIDGFDLVVRVNWQWPITTDMQDDLGTRMDILYHCSKNEPYATPFHDLFDHEEFHKLSMVYFVRQQRDGQEFESLLEKHNIPHEDISPFCNQLKNEVCPDLNTGYVAIRHLASMPLSQLHVVGFSFHREPYYEGYCTANWWDDKGQFVSTGQPDILLDDFKKLKKQDARITTDRTLKKILFTKVL